MVFIWLSLSSICFSWGILNQVQDDGQWLLLGDPESTASWRFRMTTVCFSWGILNQVQDDLVVGVILNLIQDPLIEPWSGRLIQDPLIKVGEVAYSE